MKQTIQRNGMKLVTASAFYKNDKAGGVGIHFPEPPKDFVQRVDEQLIVWDANATPEDIHAQLKECGEYMKNNGSPPKNMSFIIFLDIIWLESRGHLIPDNFNGGYWQWTPA